MSQGSHFEKGEPLWKRIPDFSNPPIFENPRDLLDRCVAYFQWVLDNPLYDHQPKVVDKTLEVIEVPRMRPMSGIALSLHAGFASGSWMVWRRDRPDLLPVILWAEDIIRTQKFEGAVGGFMNANLIARDLGLSEKVESTSTVVTIQGRDAEL